MMPNILKRKRSILQSYSVAASILMITVIILVWYSTERFHQFFIEQLETSLNSRAVTVNEFVSNKEIEPFHCQFLKNSDPSTRVTIVSNLGKVLCDSEADPLTMDNHLSRPEIAMAIQKNKGSVIRFSNTVQHSLLYVAVKKQYKQESIVIRTAIPLLEVDNLLKELNQQFYFVMMIFLTIIIGTIWFIYSKINKPLNNIVKTADLIVLGEFDATLPEYDIKEIDHLGHALNNMTNHLGRLENLRIDFVANVSHELKTPIATIQSYVETLLDGAMHDKKDIERFLNIVLKQNNRLSHIVDDLLMLSRLENSPRKELLRTNKLKVKDLFLGAVDLCHVRAEKKNIKIKLITNSKEVIEADQSLMLQALVNLIDNAIKYSDEGGKINLSSEIDGVCVHLIISDKGPGISEHHFHRLFERFYRTDKSRSRQQGGTGLGLAIVKHIVQIHKGSISVKNNSKGGCRFIISFKL
ncbi:MAG: signal transduction histidine kinase [Parasphingorhabdus sp.]|jgi:signal transduction histidine kinase